MAWGDKSLGVKKTTINVRTSKRRLINSWVPKGVNKCLELKSGGSIDGMG